VTNRFVDLEFHFTSEVEVKWVLVLPFFRGASRVDVWGRSNDKYHYNNRQYEEFFDDSISVFIIRTNDWHTDYINFRSFSHSDEDGMIKLAKVEVYGCYNTSTPTNAPTSEMPTEVPTGMPTETEEPSLMPTVSPTLLPVTTEVPSLGPTVSPTLIPVTNQPVLHADFGLLGFTLGETLAIVLVFMLTCFCCVFCILVIMNRKVKQLKRQLCNTYLRDRSGEQTKETRLITEESGRVRDMEQNFTMNIAVRGEGLRSTSLAEKQLERGPEDSGL